MGWNKQKGEWREYGLEKLIKYQQILKSVINDPDDSYKEWIWSGKCNLISYDEDGNKNLIEMSTIQFLNEFSKYVGYIWNENN